ncbi:MAG: DUF1802 family protein [Chloroflexi bacterium]|nr:DUF1802 family protein [Chloroflexota bacterium]
MQDACQAAFKEWAVTVDALARGEQILLMRKGGIREPNRRFQVEHDRFLLYPGYLHQDAALLKPQYHSRLGTEDNRPDSSPDSSKVTFGVYAEIVDVIQIDSEDAAATLDRFHIWAPGFALKRIHWKPLHPLNAILLRCYSLVDPITMPVLPEYSGCTSWVDLDEEVPLGQLVPALSDDEFGRLVTEVRDALSSAPTTA